MLSEGGIEHQLVATDGSGYKTSADVLQKPLVGCVAVLQPDTNVASSSWFSPLLPRRDVIGAVPGCRASRAPPQVSVGSVVTLAESFSRKPLVRDLR